MALLELTLSNLNENNFGRVRSDVSKMSTEEELLEQVADVPFEVLQKARSDGASSSFQRPRDFDTKRANKNRYIQAG